MNKPVFSPSSTLRWSNCPVRYFLEHEQGWKTKFSISGMLIPRLAGQLIANKIANYLDSSIELEENPLEKVNLRTSDLGEDMVAEKVLKTVEAGFKVFTEQNPYIDMETVWVEKAFPEYGNARLDALFRNKDSGKLVLPDFKLTSRTPARYAYHHNMHHYAWVVREILGELPSRVELCIINSKELTIIPVSVTEESVEAWLQTNQQAWERMQNQREGLEKPWMNPSHTDERGNACPFQDACLRFMWDEQLMKAGGYEKEV